MILSLLFLVNGAHADSCLLTSLSSLSGNQTLPGWAPSGFSVRAKEASSLYYPSGSREMTVLSRASRPIFSYQEVTSPPKGLYQIKTENPQSASKILSKMLLTSAPPYIREGDRLAKTLEQVFAEAKSRNGVVSILPITKGLGKDAHPALQITIDSAPENLGGRAFVRTPRELENREMINPRLKIEISEQDRTSVTQSTAEIKVEGKTVAVGARASDGLGFFIDRGEINIGVGKIERLQVDKRAADLLNVAENIARAQLAGAKEVTLKRVNFKTDRDEIYVRRNGEWQLKEKSLDLPAPTE